MSFHVIMYCKKVIKIKSYTCDDNYKKKMRMRIKKFFVDQNKT